MFSLYLKNIGQLPKLLKGKLVLALEEIVGPNSNLFLKNKGLSLISYSAFVNKNFGDPTQPKNVTWIFFLSQGLEFEKKLARLSLLQINWLIK